MKSFALMLMFLVLGLKAQGAVWTATQNWNEAWEDKFAVWVSANMKTDMFTNPSSPYFGIATDCADMTYFARAIFAMENGLPFIMNTRWENGGERISHETNRFDQVADLVTSVKFMNDKQQAQEFPLVRPLNNGKFRAFLTKMGHRVGTWSLPQDTYPIKVDRENLRPGVVYLRQGYNRMSTLEAIQTFLTGTPPNPEAGPGHALMVFNVRNTGVVEFIQSTLPKRVRNLSMIYEIELLPTNKKLGFRRFVQPQQLNQNFGTQLLGFSDEQYTTFGVEKYQTNTNDYACSNDPYSPMCTGSTQNSTRRSIKSFRDEVMKRIATKSESSSEKNERLVLSLCGTVRERADIILNAEPYRLRFGNGCMDDGSYDNFSTPSRDEQIRQFMKQISFNSQAERILDSCGSVKISPSGTVVEVKDLIANLRSGRFSSNPNENIPARWGYERPSNRCEDKDH